MMIATFLFIDLCIAILTGFIIFLSNSLSLGFYQNNKMLKVVILINTFTSSIILIPFQIITGLFVISLTLFISMLVPVICNCTNNFIYFLALVVWLCTIQFYPKFIWLYIEKRTNSVGKYIQLPKKVSSFVEYMFRGKIVVYCIAVLFVILNNYNIISGGNAKLIFTEPQNTIMSLSNTTVLTFLAIDRIIESIKKWKANPV